jgi:hypothetical protein
MQPCIAIASRHAERSLGAPHEAPAHTPCWDDSDVVARMDNRVALAAKGGWFLSHLGASVSAFFERAERAVVCI